MSEAAREADGARERRERPVLRSILPRPLKVWLAAAVGLGAFMLANTLYLVANRAADGAGWEFFAVGQTSLPALFQAMVLTHTGVGLLLAALMLAFLIAHLPTVWKRRHPASILSGIGMALVGTTLVVTGLFILTAAASREHRWAWWVHVACAVLIVMAYASHRLVSYARPPRVRARRFAGAVTGIFALAVAAHMLTHREVELTPEAEAALAEGLEEGPGGVERDVSPFAEAWFGLEGFAPIGFVPRESPFFPAATTTSSGTYLPARIITRTESSDSEGSAAAELRRRVAAEVRERGFAVEARIGAGACARCHPDVTEQWAASAHRFASMNNPFYEATINDMRERALEPNPAVRRHMEAFGLPAGNEGRVKSKWCSGCHDPALMLAGAMTEEIDRESLEAQAGLTCLACHAIDRVHDVTGNGNYNIADAQEDPYLFADAPPGSWREFLHDASIKAKPTVHIRQMIKPVHSTSEFCATCHKVSLQEPVNGYRWLRGQDEYDAWHDSGVAHNASRTFYLPPAARVCQECHMPLEPAPLGDVAADGGMVRSHRFLAVNTGLPFVRGDTATIRRIEDFLRDEKLRVDIFAVRRADGVPIMPLDEADLALRPGEVVTFDVVVRNQGVGHTFPGGTNDSNEGWLEFTVLDQAGGVVARSGAILENGHLDPMAHVYKAVILDGEGEPIQRRNAQDIHVPAAVNVIGPGTGDVAHYRLRIPAGTGALTVRARLLWRKFDRPYTEFAYRTNPEGFARFSDVPDLPVTEIAGDEVELAVAAPGAPRETGRAGAGAGEPDRTEGAVDRRRGTAGTAVDPSRPGALETTPPVPRWVRFNDYGIALLLEGNTRAARAPFAEVERLEPDRIDGPLNLARAALADGNLESAYAHLRRVEELSPRNPRAAWVWGAVLQSDGRFRESALAYREVLATFPNDRQAWFQLGRTLYLDRLYEEAVAAFDEVLRIDPEHRDAHYNRMLSLRALGREAEAEIAEAAFERYRIDEAAAALTREYRARNPGVNLMALPIHTHELNGPRGAP